ncbi:SulP family inorganic anion transporter [Candidatus Kaiserbacteria bacterium]|nr:SulP family inorganic anion transporter [Candidatus Kaiserbacteria bacterium]
MSNHQPWHQPSRTWEMLLPFVRWIRTYTVDTLRFDTLAGLTVAAILIPQAMAYAMLAGLPPIAGFYAALVGAVAAALWGNSRKLSTGPVALVSFLVLTALVPFAEPGSAEYLVLAAALAVLSGTMLFLLGIFRLGFIMRVIPHTVIIGFATAAELIIIVTQIPSLLGFSALHYEFMLPTIASIATHSINMHGPTVIVGVASLALLIALKRLSWHIPAELLVLVAMTVASFAFDFDTRGIATVGEVQAIVPSFSFPVLSFTDWLVLLNKAWIIALVGFIGTYAIVRSISTRTKERIDIDQELVGQGMGNIAAGLFHGFPVSGSFSRTAVNVSAGAHTGIASVCAAVIVFGALILIAPIFSLIPLATLSAIVIVAVAGAIDIGKVRDMYRASRTDGIVAILTFAIAFVLKPDDAVAIGVIVALALFMRKIVWAEIRMLGIEPEWGILQGAETGTVETFRGVLILRIETSAFYGNIDYIVRTIDKLVMDEESGGNQIHALVLDCSSVTYIDLSGAETLREYLEGLTTEGITAYGIYMHLAVTEQLERVGALPYLTILHNIREMRAALNLPEPSVEPKM